MLGPSGSGKTTCLRLIAGFEAPDAGTCCSTARDVTGVPPYERDVNTVFQDYALFPHMTVLENVAYGLRVRGSASRAAAARARDAGAGAARRFGERRPSQLSGGQRQRVALARALDQSAARAAARRAARRARPEAARGDADRAQESAAPARHHVRLRDARPGRGAVDGGSRRRVQPRPDRAAGHAARAVHASGHRVRRALRRQRQRGRGRARAAAERARASHSRCVPSIFGCARRRAVERATRCSCIGTVVDVQYHGATSRLQVQLEAASCSPRHRRRGTRASRSTAAFAWSARRVPLAMGARRCRAADYCGVAATRCRPFCIGGRRSTLALLLVPPLLWFGTVYLGSLFALLAQSFYAIDEFTARSSTSRRSPPTSRSSRSRRMSTSCCAR